MTLLQQSYLRPLPIHIAPVYWGFEHALRVYPIPHAVRLIFAQLGFDSCS